LVLLVLLGLFVQRDQGVLAEFVQVSGTNKDHDPAHVIGY
jgi:hypothetical protein